jgi:hypothetical protein
MIRFWVFQYATCRPPLVQTMPRAPSEEICTGCPSVPSSRYSRMNACVFPASLDVYAIHRPSGENRPKKYSFAPPRSRVGSAPAFAPGEAERITSSPLPFEFPDLP